jgi:DNA-binding transcriptional MerR regulator/methylmalonyl-CoA mutase cobalamin-binding subunit
MEPMSIGEVAARTGVPATTLRAWERRYGLVTPSRSRTAYLGYDDLDLDRITAMRALVDSGVPARRAASIVLDRIEGGAAHLAGPIGPHPQAQHASPLADVGALTRVAVSLDPAGLDDTLDAAFSLAAVETVIDTWLMPCLVDLGAAWARGEIDICAEHFVSAAVHRRLSALFDAAASSGREPVLVGSAPGSRHDLGALAFAVCLRRTGRAVVYLGADVPVASWLSAADTSRARAVVIAVTLTGDRAGAAEAVAALVSQTGLPVYTGGPQSDSVPGAKTLPSTVSLAARVVGQL